ncbi:MAG: hypothetical protein GXC73_15535 [Chitinophagaceae bacterium]|nr:hypothetical protein [Chitinophagaceae bacterium]
MDDKYQLNEFPSIDDDQSIYFLYLLQEFISPVNDLIEKITSSEIKSRTTMGLALPILFRLVECAQSTALLLMKNRVRDASILLLNIYEIRLDAIYISLDSAREEIWINSNKKSSKPWKVAVQQKEIFKDPDELESEKNIYRNFSMVKHGNIAGTHMSFPISFSNNSLIFAGSHPRQPTGHIFALCGFLNSAISAMFIILERHNNKFSDVEKAIEEAYDKIKNTSTSNITELIYELVFRKYPDLKDIENIKQRLRINIDTSNEDEGLKIEVTVLEKK